MTDHLTEAERILDNRSLGWMSVKLAVACLIRHLRASAPEAKAEPPRPKFSELRDQVSLPARENADGTFRVTPPPASETARCPSCGTKRGDRPYEKQCMDTWHGSAARPSPESKPVETAVCCWCERSIAEHRGQEREEGRVVCLYYEPVETAGRRLSGDELAGMTLGEAFDAGYSFGVDDAMAELARPAPQSAVELTVEEWEALECAAEESALAYSAYRKLNARAGVEALNPNDMCLCGHARFLHTSDGHRETCRCPYFKRPETK